MSAAGLWAKGGAKLEYHKIQLIILKNCYIMMNELGGVNI